MAVKLMPNIPQQCDPSRRNMMVFLYYGWEAFVLSDQARLQFMTRRTPLRVSASNPSCVDGNLNEAPAWLTVDSGLFKPLGIMGQSNDGPLRRPRLQCEEIVHDHDYSRTEHSH